MSGGWDQALDAMTDLQHQFHTEEGRQYMQKFARSIAGKIWSAGDRDGYEPHTPTGEDVEHARALVRGTMTTVVQGEPIWVSADVVDLIEAASDPDIDRPFVPEAIYFDDLFVPWGFALLEHHLEHPDVRGKAISYRGVSWGITQPPDADNETGVLVALWCHRDDPDGYREPRQFPMVGGCPLTLVHAATFSFGDTRHLADPPTHAMMRQLQIMWRLAKQEIALPQRERASRPSWKRAATWKQIKHVTVLRLRRAKPSHYEGEERDVEWTHRFLVRGHWRNQWYPKLKDHRQIWIETYVKGDESLPLVVKKRAIEFTR